MTVEVKRRNKPVGEDCLHVPSLNKNFQVGAERYMPRVVLTLNSGAKTSNIRMYAKVSRPQTCVLLTAALEICVMEDHCQRPAPLRFWHAHLWPFIFSFSSLIKELLL